MTLFSRRQALRLGLTGISALAIPALFLNRATAQHAHHGSVAQSASAPVKLPHPTLIEPDQNGLVKLQIAKGQHSFQAGSKVASAGINGDYFGPLIRLHQDKPVRFAINNTMNEATTLHWHGLIIPSDMDGGPHNMIKSGGLWQPEFTITQAPSFNWFHAHLHQDTARQVQLGIAGLLQVTDGGDRERGLPDQFGIDDLFLAVQDRRVIDGDTPYAPNFMDLMHGFRGEYLAVNGAIAPVATVPKSIVRLRLLNASNARNYHFRFADGRMMHVIASDGGYIAKPVALDMLTIAPGERYEILVDFSSGQSVDFVSLSDDGSGRTPEPMHESEHIMRFTVNDALKADVTKLVSNLDALAKADPSQAVKTRTFLFDENMAENMKQMDSMTGKTTMPAMQEMDHSKMDHSNMPQMSQAQAVTAASSGISMAMAGKPFDMERIDVEVKHGSMEIWKLKAQEMGHPFHIHGAHFRILTKNGKPPADHQTGWKDTVLVDDEAELLVHFKAEAKRSHPLMFHCHILEHEDAGMMGQLITT